MHNATSRLARRFALLALLVAAPASGVGCIAPTDGSDDVDEAGEEVGGDDITDGAEDVESSEAAVSGGTVLQATASSCSTTSVKKLSQQIIDEVRCMNPNAYVLVPKKSNITFGSAAFRYMEKPARDKLVAALEANPGKQMTVNSMLRTVAQQYMLYRWYQTGRCGIGLAAKPGSSNHESGLAIDINQYSSWKSALNSRGFNWLGSSDPVHFDYAGSGAVSYKSLGVKAFQRLWNRNHTSDKIDADGAWGPQTEARMKKAPANGFTKGATCNATLLGPSFPGDEIDAEETSELEDSADFGASAEIERAHVEEPVLLDPEPIDAALVEQLALESEGEVCSDHALEAVEHGEHAH
ncbi:M15 family metallopeptidase [Chondromyces apiculatus]|uniref:Putative peptidoglycan binding domain 1 n=1 Tax=Chondromyces apiculatus DSM 436 TaxID=1192034 RepID=A0A017T7G6_9BACT|nr:M15 family metallopeptidase [Chondromyces apiculatus]EYF04750.1 Putative peptidoglycan binding domain 1 [Chondromyces apiculatus DSM 436]